METDSSSDSEPNLPIHGAGAGAGAAGGHTYVSVDTDSEDGGMQLEPADGELNLDFEDDDSDMDFDERITDEDRDENDFTTHAINPHSPTPNAHNTPSQPGHRDLHDHGLGLPSESRDRPRPRPRRLRINAQLTEEQHAALSVLSNWELLVTHALNSHRTIPQIRRRFQAKLLAPNNPTLENELYASRFVVPASKSEFLPPVTPSAAGGGAAGRAYETASGADNSIAWLIPGSYREVVDGDQSSWWPMGKPRVKRKSDRGSGAGSGLGSGSGVRGRRDGSASGGGSGESSRVVSRGGSRSE